MRTAALVVPPEGTRLVPLHPEVCTNNRLSTTHEWAPSSLISALKQVMYLLRAHTKPAQIVFCLKSAPAIGGLVQRDNVAGAGAISKTLERLIPPHTCLDLPPQSASQLSPDPRGYVKRNRSVS